MRTGRRATSRGRSKRWPRRLNADDKHTTLVGATGTGKTATMAWIDRAGRQKPALVIAHNKTLAAQLCNEFREFFPHNAVEYFVSYYDYYQPEAYVPQADLYIEKDSSQNDDIARSGSRRRRRSSRAGRGRRRLGLVHLRPRLAGGVARADDLARGRRGARPRLFLRKLIDSQYVRNDTVLGRGRFRVKGDVVEVQPRTRRPRTGSPSSATR
jgi:excinuclease ABC subunit B